MDMTVIKGGMYMTNRRGPTKKMFAACVCPECDHITKLVWHIDADKDIENSESVVPRAERKNLANCPICSGKLSLSRKNFVCGENNASDKLISNILIGLKKNNIEKYSNEVKAIVEESCLADGIETEIKNTDVVKNNVQNLKDYLRYAVKIESAVRFYEELLINLKMELCYNNKKYISYTARQVKQQQEDNAVARQEIAKLEAKIQALEVAFECTDFKADVKMQKISKPSEPLYINTIKLSAPAYPELKKSGLFNKKKVEEQNAELIANYNAQQERYLAACEKNAEIARENAALRKQYEKTLLEYKENQKQQEYEIQEAAKCLKEKAQKEKEFEIAKIKEKIAVLSEEKNVKKTENYVSMFILNDIKSAEKQLIAAVKARTAFYGYNIIYPKYRNYVAITTLCEYIESGRCSSLEGADGAYNLYETECMNNLIVSQLNVIADKLEDIKQNQILMYGELKTINQNIKKLNETMKEVVANIHSLNVNMSDMKDYIIDISSNIQDIKDTNKKIAENTAITAHYSELTARYTKLNCEVANALGFMVAFK